MLYNIYIMKGIFMIIIMHTLWLWYTLTLYYIVLYYTVRWICAVTTVFYLNLLILNSSLFVFYTVNQIMLHFLVEMIKMRIKNESCFVLIVVKYTARFPSVNGCVLIIWWCPSASEGGLGGVWWQEVTWEC